MSNYNFKDWTTILPSTNWVFKNHVFINYVLKSLYKRLNYKIIKN